MKVLVLGASGFIGLPIAHTLIHAGHLVYGLTHSQEKAKKLAAEDDWVHLISDLDLVIDLAGGSADIQMLSVGNLEAFTSTAQATHLSHAPELNYIYASVTWVHGDNRTDVITDSTPPQKPAELMVWHLESEQKIITDQCVNRIVIRPALLYGRDGSLLSSLFKSAADGFVRWPGTLGGRYALIHVDDLADLYVRAAEKAPIIHGIIFDAVNKYSESADDILQALAKVVGANIQSLRTVSILCFESKLFFTNLSAVYETALLTTSLICPYLARTLLDWCPLKSGLVDGMQVYYAAWKAAQK
ncbi:hypothetical protein M422DRAFT_60820 [Sphaerobolus stellatus SS14]|uniref:NAD-dependent epimerase/dehydratase domain-containing protein n=1 Tax=Sphaerobolus stellatus (strain SS14) TaxID=990650 RepID=A0A0C9VLW2_SPHS4|nr:hypothetical protein M422DRAFT_60820 [Sphaerobolus stellatus SS14]